MSLSIVSDAHVLKWMRMYSNVKQKRKCCNQVLITSFDTAKMPYLWAFYTFESNFGWCCTYMYTEPPCHLGIAINDNKLNFQALSSTVPSFYWFSRTSNGLSNLKDFQVLCLVLTDFQGLQKLFQNSRITVPSFDWLSRTSNGFLNLKDLQVLCLLFTDFKGHQKESSNLKDF